jgi:hypothetical protein
MKASNLGLFVALTSAMTFSCGPDDGLGESGDNVEVVRSALNDPFGTSYNAQVAVGASTEGMVVAWQGTDGNPQIVGEGFNPDGGPRDFPIQADIYSDGIKPKSFPSVASDVDTNQYLVVWQEDYSPTDSDIKGRIVRDNGNVDSPSPLDIETGTFTEKMPSVVLVREVNKWLVVYTNTTSTQTSILGRWVDFSGVKSAFFEIVTSGVNTASQGRITTASCFGTNRVLITWNDNRAAFLNISNPAAPTLGPVQVISPAAGLAGACNIIFNQPTTYAVTWREGTGNGAKVGVRVFPQGCFDLTCATPAVFPIQGDAVTNSLQLPVIASKGFGYGVAEGLTQSSVRKVSFATIAANGSILAGGGINSIVDPCTGTKTGVVGAPGAIAAASVRNDPNRPELVVYDAFCSNQAKVRLSSVSAPGFVTHNASD